MNNAEYEREIEALIPELDRLNEEAISIAGDIIGSTVLLVDLGFSPLLNRSLQLTDGFIAMIKARNLTCAATLLRLQLDNCMRLYALYIAEDRKAFINSLMAGEKIDKLRDKNGQQMKDWYLKKELTKLDTQFSTVYDNTSGYIHFSGKAFYQSVSAGEDNTLEFQVSHTTPEKLNPILLECVRAYTHYLEFFYLLIRGAAEAKAKFESEQQEAQP
ncbi:hypothetical protein AAAT68_00070 [Lawsonibacter asaccharolyticus]